MTLFGQYGADDVRALIEDYPLAWVCGGYASNMEASLLPLVGQFGPDGRLVELAGHLMKSNPLYRALRADERATILFKGPESYVSPQNAGLRDWAPTWNYAQLKIRAEIRFDDAFTETSLQLLIEAMEAGRPDPWTVSELGPRYHTMLEHIIGFRCSVTDISGIFKLGQDEGAAVFDNIVATLNDEKLVAWMRRLNLGRPDAVDR